MKRSLDGMFLEAFLMKCTEMFLISASKFALFINIAFLYSLSVHIED